MSREKSLAERRGDGEEGRSLDPTHDLALEDANPEEPNLGGWPGLIEDEQAGGQAGASHWTEADPDKTREQAGCDWLDLTEDDRAGESASGELTPHFVATDGFFW